MDREDWDQRYEGDELVWKAAPNRFLVEQVEHMPAAGALDVACGEGRNAVWLAEQGWHVTGADFSRVGLDKARRMAEARGVAALCEWMEADVRDWEPPKTYELVAVFYLQLEPAERANALRIAAEAVADGGTLLVVGHDTENLTAGVGGPQDPAVLFSAADIVADLEGCGLSIERAEQVRRPVEVDGRMADALDVLVRAHRG